MKISFATVVLTEDRVAKTSESYLCSKSECGVAISDPATSCGKRLKSTRGCCQGLLIIPAIMMRRRRRKMTVRMVMLIVLRVVKGTCL